ncbi:MAG: PRD domain-containing protein [Actinomycetaceae bacterium]|nr:PRD domain-containing protein [Actinomycetaceae bacterium]
MDVLRVFNNNVVLARSADGTEVILTGRGLGFQVRSGDRVDPEKVARTFVPADGRDPDHLAELLTGIPPELVQMVAQGLGEIGVDEKLISSPTLVIALADHLGLALVRIKEGTQMEYPLTGEVLHLYPQEHAQARALLHWLNTRLDTHLPEYEATAFTLHLVNAGFITGDLSYTYQMTGVIQQVIHVVEAELGVTLDPLSVNVGRFITHLRYLFVRVRHKQQLNQDVNPITLAIQQSCPKEHACAQNLARVMELRLGAELTPDEISYLTLHVARVAASSEK